MAEPALRQPVAPGRPWRRRLTLATAAACPLLLAVLLYYWHERRDTWGGRTGAEWSLKLMVGTAEERKQAETGLRALGSNAVPSLCRAMLKPDSRIRAFSLRVARRSPRTVRDWIYRNFLGTEPSTRRMAASQGLAFLGPTAEAAIPDLVAGLSSRDASISWQASQTLGRIGSTAVPALVPLLQDPEPAVRLQAAYALGQVGRPAASAVPALQASLETTNLAHCQATIQALTRIWTNPVLHYSNLIATRRGPAREAAVRAIRQFNFPSRPLQPALLEMLQDESPGARQAAVQALGVLPGWTPATFTALCAARSDPDPLVRSNALVMLADANLRARITTRSLLLLVADPGADSRREAVQALGALGTNALPAVPELEALAARPEEFLRQPALEALERITNTAPR
jgi:HEAT repeat protein